MAPLSGAALVTGSSSPVPRLSPASSSRIPSGPAPWSVTRQDADEQMTPFCSGEREPRLEAVQRSSVQVPRDLSHVGREKRWNVLPVCPALRCVHQRGSPGAGLDCAGPCSGASLRGLMCTWAWIPNAAHGLDSCSGPRDAGLPVSKAVLPHWLRFSWFVWQKCIKHLLVAGP